MQIQKYKRAIAESNVLAATWLPVLGGMVGGTRCHKSPSWAVTISREVYYDDNVDVDESSMMMSIMLMLCLCLCLCLHNRPVWCGHISV